MAAEHGYVDVVRLLLDGGAEVDCEDDLGQTPLSVAVRLEHRDIVRLLIEKGAEQDGGESDSEMEFG